MKPVENKGEKKNAYIIKKRPTEGNKTKIVSTIKNPLGRRLHCPLCQWFVGVTIYVYLLSWPHKSVILLKLRPSSYDITA